MQIIKYMAVLWLAFTGVSSTGWASDSYELRYGSSERILLKKSNKFIGLQLFNGETIESFCTRQEKFERWSNLGGFQIFKAKQVQDLDSSLDLMREQGLMCTHAYHFPGNPKVPFIPTGNVYVKPKPNYKISEVIEYVRKIFSVKIESINDIEFILKVTGKSLNPIKIAVNLQKERFVMIAEPDLASFIREPLSKTFSSESSSSSSEESSYSSEDWSRFSGISTSLHHGYSEKDVLMDAQWHLKNSGYHRGTRAGLTEGADARIIEAWNHMSNRGSQKIVVAVIDDGFDLSHPDLKGSNKVISPWDFTRNNSDPTPDRGNWHGTACAGLAVGNEGGGDIIGVAPCSKFMPIRWGPGLSDEQVELWFDYATKNGADIVSCSWGSASKYFPLSTRQQKAIEKCATKGRQGKGCVIVFAAGNDNHDINYDGPGIKTLDGFATHPNVIAVAASTSIDMRSNYSNFGKEISVCAPSDGAGGMGILTADVTKRYGGSTYPGGYNPGDYTFGFGGTSSACPIVAGVCALMLSVNPSLTSVEVKNILQSTAREIGDGYDIKGHSVLFGYGCINALAAVQEVQRRLADSKSSSEKRYSFASSYLPRHSGASSSSRWSDSSSSDEH